MMNASISFILLACYSIAKIVAIEGEHDKDVEIIAGSDIPQSSPLDAKFVGQAYPNDIYGPQVRHLPFRENVFVAYFKRGPIHTVTVSILITNYKQGSCVLHRSKIISETVPLSLKKGNAMLIKSFTFIYSYQKLLGKLGQCSGLAKVMASMEK